MGKTSAAVKNKYNSKAYDRVALSLKKGYKEVLQEHAKKAGQSLNAYITQACDERIERERTE